VVDEQEEAVVVEAFGDDDGDEYFGNRAQKDGEEYSPVTRSRSTEERQHSSKVFEILMLWAQVEEEEVGEGSD